MSTFHCKHCDRPVFRSEDLLERVSLWDLGDYQADCYAIREAIDQEALDRYDVSLHEGWYCCRFIMMRMCVDKFGTGDRLLVYTDSVVEREAGAEPPARREAPHAIKLTAKDYDAVLASHAERDELVVVKLGAIWCPPCRLMDAVIARIGQAGELPEVRFFEVDIDEEPELAGRFRNQSIPHTRFYHRGRLVPVTAEDGPTLDGGLLGGIGQVALMALCRRLLARARASEPAHA